MRSNKYELVPNIPIPGNWAIFNTDSQRYVRRLGIIRTFAHEEDAKRVMKELEQAHD